MSFNDKPERPHGAKSDQRSSFKKKPYQADQTSRFQDRPSGHSTEPPRLRWGRDNNLLQFTKLLTISAGVQYGQLAHSVLVEGKALKISIPKEDKYDLSTVVGREMLKIDVQERSKKLSKMNEDQPKLYYYIYGFLSQESEDAVKSHENFEECRKEQSPLKLWKIINETHRTASQTRDRQLLAYEARESYHRVRQGPINIKRIIGFKERFDEALRNYKDFDNPQMSDVDIATDFYRKLDPARYHDFQTKLMNDISQQIRSPPKDLNEVFQLAKTFYVTRKSADAKHATGGVAFNTVFADSFEHSEYDMPRKQRGRYQPGRDKKEPSDEDQDNPDGQKTKPKRAHKLEDVKCYGCGELGHYRSACPNVNTDNNYSNIANTQQATQRTNNKDAQVHCTTSYSLVFQSGKRSVFKWWQVLLDNQANMSIVHPKLLTNLQPTKAYCSGIDGTPFRLTHTGNLEGFFQCRSSKDLSASVLCLTDVGKLYKITYNQDESFVVHLPGGELTFHLIDKLYVGDMREWGNKKIENPYLTPLDEPRVLTTVREEYVEEQLPHTRYTRAQQKDAEEAWQLIRNAGHLSER